MTARCYCFDSPLPRRAAGKSKRRSLQNFIKALRCEGMWFRENVLFQSKCIKNFLSNKESAAQRHEIEKHATQFSFNFFSPPEMIAYILFGGVPNVGISNFSHLMLKSTLLQSWEITIDTPSPWNLRGESTPCFFGCK